MVWAIFGLAVVAIGMTATFTGLYAVELKKRHAAQSERLTYELALKSSQDTVEGLKAERGRYSAQESILRRALEECEDALADSGGGSAALRAKLDGLLSGPLPEDSDGPGEGGGAVSPSPKPDPPKGGDKPV